MLCCARHDIDLYLLLPLQGAHFPEAQVLLTATAEANNRAAKDASTSHYQRYLRKLTHNGSVYIKHETMVEEEMRARDAALGLFDKRADFGPSADIARFKSDLTETLDRLGAEAVDQNKKRDPMSTMGPYLLAVVVMAFFWVFRMALDTFCWADVCGRASNAASTINSTIFLGLLIVAWQSGAVTLQRINAFMDAAGSGGGISAGSVMSAVAAAAAARSPASAAGGKEQGSAGSWQAQARANRIAAGADSAEDEQDDSVEDSAPAVVSPSSRNEGGQMRRRRKA
jgi:hypothetical protein